MYVRVLVALSALIVVLTAPPVAGQAPEPPFPQPADRGDRVYTANEDDNTISVINPATNEVEATIALGDGNHHRPLYNGHIDIHGLLASPDGSVLAATARGSSAVVFVDRRSGEVQGYALVGREPHVATFSPDGKQVWVTVRGERYVAVVDPVTREVIDRIPTVDGPSMVWFSADGSRAFVGSQKVPILQVFDAASRQLVKEIEMPGPFSPFVLATPDGDEVWVTQKTTNTVTVIDAASLAVKHVLPVGNRPNHVAFVGDRAYVTIAMDNTVEVYQRNGQAAPSLATVLPMGQEPHGIWPNRDGSRLYVGHEKSGDVRVLDTASGTVIAQIAVGAKPIDLIYVASTP